MVAAITLLSVFFLIYLVSVKNKPIFNILMLALILRMVAALVHLYLFKLPVGLHDAVAFEQIAWDIVVDADGVFHDLLNSYQRHVRYNYSWGYAFFLSVLYYVFGREPIILQSVSVFIGVLVVFMTWKITLRVWGNEAAGKRAAFLVAIFPPMIMYSAVTMREIIIIFFIQLALILIIEYLHSEKIKKLMLSMGAVLPHFFLHNPAIIGLMIGYVYVLYPRFKRYVFSFFRGKAVGLAVVVGGVFVTLLLMSSIEGLLRSGITVGYIGNVSEFGLDNIVSYTRNTNYGNAVYPDFVVPDDVSGLFYLFPARLMYFLYSPFPWDIYSPRHIVGMVDALLYVYLTYVLLSNWSSIRGNKAALFCVFLFIVLVSIYSFGVGNFANAMRHRLKFMFLLLIAVSPFIKGLKIYNK